MKISFLWLYWCIKSFSAWDDVSNSEYMIIYDCQIECEIFNPIGIIWYRYDGLPKYGNIPKYLLACSESLSEWNVSGIE